MPARTVCDSTVTIARPARGLQIPKWWEIQLNRDKNGGSESGRRGSMRGEIMSSLSVPILHLCLSDSAHKLGRADWLVEKGLQHSFSVNGFRSIEKFHNLHNNFFSSSWRWGVLRKAPFIGKGIRAIILFLN